MRTYGWTRLAVATGLITLLGLPLVHAVWSALRAATDSAAWTALVHDPQTARALALSLWSGVCASVLSVALCAWILSRSFNQAVWSRLMQVLGPLLAVPHAAFAIGLVFLIAPSGWVLRALSPWATGLQTPPPWTTSQDPWALGLIAALVAKEVPFLLWAAAAHLQRSEVAQNYVRALQVARSMGYNPHQAWWYVVWPQLWPRLVWPMLAVLAYSMTVVDVALVSGPGSPPTLAVVAWSWLLDADATTNAQGAAAAWLLAALLIAIAALAWHISQWPRWRRRWSAGRRGRAMPVRGAAGGSVAALLLVGLYVLVLLALALGSVSGVWPFPALLPDNYTMGAWRSVWRSADTVGITLVLGMTSAVTALLWAITWLETAPPQWDAALRQLVYLPLLLPAVLWVVGVHATTLALGFDGRWSGLWLAHSMACTPYVLIALGPAYGGFDPRVRQIAASLGHGHLVFLWRLKWPMLRGAIAAALAVGFAVSVAQYLPTLFVGAGRFSTVTTEAVTLASGGQRSLTSAYAWLQWLLPVLAFGAAAWVGRPRRF